MTLRFCRVRTCVDMRMTNRSNSFATHLLEIEFNTDADSKHQEYCHTNGKSDCGNALCPLLVQVTQIRQRIVSFIYKFFGLGFKF